MSCRDWPSATSGCSAYTNNGEGRALHVTVIRIAGASDPQMRAMSFWRALTAWKNVLSVSRMEQRECEQKANLLWVAGERIQETTLRLRMTINQKVNSRHSYVNNGREGGRRTLRQGGGASNCTWGTRVAWERLQQGTFAFYQDWAVILAFN
ncbi:hypothetical protein GOP47_0000126 [Adiantum capillus-veneris]|uniref:Uncharacterized protein n=1 Tax=Adiantum capillus-veneris TaxID=13818 RepID=A0A9D4VD04_ADICA|nr:hypothetical protein GOP47_0000126 [Adiantum capillus-veneris]